jgi:sugar transferase (PEP-CTERM/EpsH1 system associated)
MSLKILFFVPYVPNQIRVRPFNLLKFLSSNGHQITLLTLWSDDKDKEDLLELETICDQVKAFYLPRWRSLTSCALTLPSREPLQSAYCWDPIIANGLKDFITNNDTKYDVIHVEHLRGARYAIFLKEFLNSNKSSIPIIWDSVDSISYLFRQATMQNKQLFSRWITQFELERTEKYEAYLLTQLDQITVTSQIDRNALLTLVPSNKDTPKISVLPNGVDLAYFKPDPEVMREEEAIVISGKMSYHANVSMTLHLVNDIMPLIWNEHPDVKLWIVGKDPPKTICNLERNQNITVTGTVADIRPYLQKATIAVTPILYGAGIQNKVLESMACETPVVSYPQAVSALDTLPGRDLLVAEEPSDFARSVLDLLKSPRLQKAIGKNGRKYVEKNHQWPIIAKDLERIYNYALVE